MEPEQLVAVDKHVVTSIRIAGLLISILIALVCVLIFKQAITLNESYYSWACLPVGGAALLIGLAMVSWEPYSLRKVQVYSVGYILVAVFLSTLVVGFSSFTFLCWLVLIALVGLYSRTLGVVLAYIAMMASLILWIGLHGDLQTFSRVAGLEASGLAVGVALYILVSIWQLTNNSLKKLADSHNRENYEHRQLMSLVNSMADGVVALDQYANVSLYNAAALNILDSNTSMQGKSISEFLKPFTKEGASIDVVNFIQNTKTATVNRDLRIKYADGSFANLYLAITPVHLGYGQQGSPGFVLLLRDITREKSLEEERDEFISVVSHELRTPIAISEGNVSNAQVIADKSGDVEQIKQALQEAHNQIVFLADMINDLATLSRAERGKLTLEVETIDVKQLLQELVSNYAPDAQKKGLELKSEYDGNLAELHSSKLYVREILQNFVTNAIKYTEKGSVTLAASAQPDGVLFSVRDTGIGISKADQERVFDKFFRSEDFRTRQNNGTGLGLYVTMKLARLIHAEINLKSELNKGSTFTIFIPSLVPEAKASAPQAPMQQPEQELLPEEVTSNSASAE